MAKEYKLTPQRLQELQDELVYLKTVREKEVAELIKEARSFRVTRNEDIDVEEDDAENLLNAMEKELLRRRFGPPIRLEISDATSPFLSQLLADQLGVNPEEVYRLPAPLDFTVLFELQSLDRPDLKNRPFIPTTNRQIAEVESSRAQDIFAAIRERDILLHHPYDSFSTSVQAFLAQAAADPKVLAIKQTLYRVSGNSPIIAALAAAAENGKQVSVLVELKARFDEENNILWAKKLEKAGCHVIYGLVGLKTHSKITLVVRREEDGIRRYVHLGTGNYNDSTARLYTDCGIMTCHPEIGEDATAVFNMLSGYSEPLTWNMLAVAPLWLRNKFLRLIGRETRHAREGRPASITAKMNSLCDKDIIAALYEASCAGVKIRLVVRGICCLKAGIRGLSENIEVRSIVGEFLEHARIFIFENDGAEEIYMGSADWMPRNLDRRVEILFPVVCEALKDRIRNYMELELEDNLKAHVLQPDGTFEKPDRRGKAPVGSQAALCALAVKAAEEARKKNGSETPSRVFIPVERQE